MYFKRNTSYLIRYYSLRSRPKKAADPVLTTDKTSMPSRQTLGMVYFKSMGAHGRIRSHRDWRTILAQQQTLPAA